MKKLILYFFVLLFLFLPSPSYSNETPVNIINIDPESLILITNPLPAHSSLQDSSNVIRAAFYLGNDGHISYWVWIEVNPTHPTKSCYTSAVIPISSLSGTVYPLIERTMSNVLQETSDFLRPALTRIQGMLISSYSHQVISELASDALFPHGLTESGLYIGTMSPEPYCNGTNGTEHGAVGLNWHPLPTPLSLGMPLGVTPEVWRKIGSFVTAERSRLAIPSTPKQSNSAFSISELSIARRSSKPVRGVSPAMVGVNGSFALFMLAILALTLAH